ncbi:neurofilament heavy polypeptide isoform X3 [Euwallacea fornicatus]|uniref:neurofilament heavy polypeptide isoform X3 n=1 Tax=Euwallacea fornicatus TaxID=995702 RepID=UPI00338D4C38
MEKKNVVKDNEKPPKDEDSEIVSKDAKIEKDIDAVTDATATESSANSNVMRNGNVSQPEVLENNEDHNSTEEQEQIASVSETEKTSYNKATEPILNKKPTVVNAGDKFLRSTRGTKRKADARVEGINTSENESTDLATIETTEQKENVGVVKNNVQVGDDLGEESILKSVSSTDEMGKGKRARVPNKRYSDIILSPNRKSGVLPKLVPENAGKVDEIVVPVVVTPSSSAPFVKRGRGPNTSRDDLQDPKYLKPFKYGWKRELVWRSTSTSTKKMGDIYYYTPTGQKVRSFRELADHLDNKNLSLDNFSYTKDLLGVNDPEKEIEREAKIPQSQSVGRDSPIPKQAEIKKNKKVESLKNMAAAETGKSVDTPKLITLGKGKKRASANTPEPSPVVKKKKEEAKESPASVDSKMERKKNISGKKMRLSKKAEEISDAKPSPSQPSRSSPRKTKAAQQSNPPIEAQPKEVKRNLKLKNLTAHESRHASIEEKVDVKACLLRDSALMFGSLLHAFQYLKVQDLLRAGCVCHMWRNTANDPKLWKTVRMKNSQVHSFEGLANALKKQGTVHLDLRKMLLPSNGDDIWPDFSKAIAKVESLQKIEFCRCPASVVEQLAISNSNLEVINAVTIKCDSLNLDSFKSLSCISELRLKSTSGLKISSIDSLKELKTLKILSLTSVIDLHTLNLNVIGELTNLVSLDLGECYDFPKNFGEDILQKLDKLEKLRLEKGQGTCHTFEILESVKNMNCLEQLELVNFDVKMGFDRALGACKNIKKLMIIPTYISQSATTNNMVLAGVLRLEGSLSNFVWGVTLELLRVTELFIDQCEDTTNKTKRTSGNGDCIPVLKPVPDLSNGNQIQAANIPAQVEILPLPNLQKLLLNSLPKTRVKILKIPFHATWRQTLTDSL